VVVDLSAVSELRGIKEADGGLEIGAMTTLTEVVNHPVVKAKFGILAEAAEMVASPQIRNQATLGGNVSQDTRCWYYRSGWSCYRAGGNICYADTPTAINREHAILQQDRCVAVSPSDTAPALIALMPRWSPSAADRDLAVGAGLLRRPGCRHHRPTILRVTCSRPSGSRTWASKQFTREAPTVRWVRARQHRLAINAPATPSGTCGWW
jgi:hypothetical protein